MKDADANPATTAWFADTLGTPGLPSSRIGPIRLSQVPGSPAEQCLDTVGFGI